MATPTGNNNNIFNVCVCVCRFVGLKSRISVGWCGCWSCSPGCDGPGATRPCITAKYTSFIDPYLEQEGSFVATARVGLGLINCFVGQAHRELLRPIHLCPRHSPLREWKPQPCNKHSWQVVWGAGPRGAADSPSIQEMVLQTSQFTSNDQIQQPA